ncbi:YcdB/YcdC domain-containing protein [Brevibacillus laterosporus]|uniref:YcdB/YcdC domain-containing protein n=1 Tax=Brevibacillus laterosporus TaxID=1465 RepID=UPI003D1D7AB7
MKYPNKLVGSVLAASLLATTPMWADQVVSAVHAEGQIAEATLPPAGEKTLSILYTLQPELKGMTRKVEKSRNGVYNVSFYQKIETDKKRLYASVELDEHTGALHSYDNDQEMSDGNKGTLTEEFAKQKSAAFLQVLLGKDFKKYKASKTSKDNSWDAVTYTRYENEMPVFLDRYVVGVNAKGVTYVNAGDTAPLRASSTVFHKPEKILSKEEITKEVASHMELSYRIDPVSGKPMLVYSLESTGYLDAGTGKEVQGVDSIKTTYSDPIAVTPGGKQVTAKNPEEVAKALADHFHVDVQGAAFTVDTRTPADMKSANETIYESKSGGRRITVYVHDDIITGFQIQNKVELASEAQHNNQPKNAKISYREAQEKAVQYLQPYLDQSVKVLKVDRNQVRMANSTAYSFVFLPVRDGVPVTNQTYLVNVDGQTGEIVNFMDGFDKLHAPFPDKKLAISKEAAAEAFLKQYPVQLGYLFPMENNKLLAKPVLVYSLEMIFSSSLDGQTGKPLN